MTEQIVLGPYKGYKAAIHWSAEVKVFLGHVNIERDYLPIMGYTKKKAEADFRSTITEYLAFCKRVGKIPEKPINILNHISFTTSFLLGGQKMVLYIENQKNV